MYASFGSGLLTVRAKRFEFSAAREALIEALKLSLPRLWAISSRMASVDIISGKVFTTWRAAVVS